MKHYSQHKNHQTPNHQNAHNLLLILAYHIPYKDKLNDDFRLGLPLDKPPDKDTVAAVQRRRETMETYRLFEQWRDGMIRRLNQCFREAHFIMKTLETPADLDSLTDAQALAIREQARVEYYSDVLTGGTMEDMMQIFRGRGMIEQLCETVLRSTPPKSEAA